MKNIDTLAYMVHEGDEWTLNVLEAGVSYKFVLELSGMTRLASELNALIHSEIQRREGGLVG